MSESQLEIAGTKRTVTAIVPRTSDPNFRSVIVGKKTAAVLRAADVESLGIQIGTRWTPRLEQSVLELVQLEKTRKAALQILGRRALSQRRLTDRLVRKGHQAAHANRIAVELLADGWLDDARFAETLLREMQLKRPIGKALALRKLESQGIDAEVAERVVSQSLGGSDPVAAAMKMARQRMRSNGAKGSADVRRIVGALARRGFDEETILAALDRLGVRCDDSAMIDPVHEETAS